MITDLETLLNQDEFKELVKAINQNQEFYCSKKGLTIKSESTDDSLFLLISYDRQEEEESCLANKEADTFQKYLESLDDDLFVGVCEYLGEDNIHRIQACLESGKLETVRSGIAKFREALSKLVNQQIEYLKSLLNV